MNSMQEIESVDGRIMSDGSRWKVEWMSGSYSVFVERQDSFDRDFWFGQGSIPAGRPWTERKLVEKVERSFIQHSMNDAGR